MATLYKRNQSPHWYVAWFDGNGRRRWRSTKTTDRKQAEKIAATFDKAVALSLAGKLSPDRAREILSAGIEDVYLAANAEALPSASIRDWCDRWLASKEIEATPTTHARYQAVLDRFYEFLGGKADRDVACLIPADIGKFRDRQASELSRNSANLAMKCLRACFTSAHKQGLLTSNPAAVVDKLKIVGEGKRRPFTVAEIKRLLDAARGSEWEGIILTGCYTGARLGDIAGLTWDNVKLDTRELVFTTGKTGRRMVLPMAAALADYFESLPSSDQPGAHVFPSTAAAGNRTGTLSGQFYRIMVAAGLAEKRKNVNTGRGHHAARKTNPLSFHCLRHSVVTFLKAAGVSDALAQAIAGHSPIVSRTYTHLDTETLRGAIEKLPDMTATKPAKGQR